MTFWPEHLVGELAQRRCLVFLGAGASAGALDADGKPLPGWEKLLRTAVDTTSNEFDKEHASRLIDRERFLDAAEVMFGESTEPKFRAFIRATFERPGLDPSEIHKLVSDIDPKIVITTNFDSIYETYCRKYGGYSVVKHTDNHLLDEIRSKERVIVKIHGCATTDPSKAVLTRSQFFRARKDNPATFAVMNSLFTVNTCLFIGYRMADPDIQLVLENSNIAAPTIHPHYALMARGEHKSLLSAVRRSYNVEVLEYDSSNGHAEAVDLLAELLECVEEFRRTYPS